MVADNWGEGERGPTLLEGSIISPHWTILFLTISLCVISCVLSTKVQPCCSISTTKDAHFLRALHLEKKIANLHWAVVPSVCLALVKTAARIFIFCQSPRCSLRIDPTALSKRCTRCAEQICLWWCGLKKSGKSKECELSQWECIFNCRKESF